MRKAGVEGGLSFNHGISETVALATQVCRDVNLDLQVCDDCLNRGLYGFKDYADKTETRERRGEEARKRENERTGGI